MLLNTDKSANDEIKTPIINVLRRNYTSILSFSFLLLLMLMTL